MEFWYTTYDNYFSLLTLTRNMFYLKTQFVPRSKHSLLGYKKKQSVNVL